MRMPRLAIAFACTCALWVGVMAAVAGAAGWTFASVRGTGVMVAAASEAPGEAARARALSTMPPAEAWRYVAGNVARPMFRAVTWTSVPVMCALGALLLVGTRATFGGRRAAIAWWVFAGTATLFAAQAWTDLSSASLYAAVWDGWIANGAFDASARAAAESAHSRASAIYTACVAATAALGWAGVHAMRHP